MDRIVPLVVGFCKVEDDELREQCFQAMESFIKRCPKEISSYVPTITDLCLKYISYDPNYNYDSEEEDEAMETGSDEEQGLCSFGELCLAELQEQSEIQI